MDACDKLGPGQVRFKDSWLPGLNQNHGHVCATGAGVLLALRKNREETWLEKLQRPTFAIGIHHGPRSEVRVRRPKLFGVTKSTALPGAIASRRKPGRHLRKRQQKDRLLRWPREGNVERGEGIYGKPQVVQRFLLLQYANKRSESSKARTGRQTNACFARPPAFGQTAALKIGALELFAHVVKVSSMPLTFKALCHSNSKDKHGCAQLRAARATLQPPAVSIAPPPKLVKKSSFFIHLTPLVTSSYTRQSRTAMEFSPTPQGLEARAASELV